MSTPASQLPFLPQKLPTTQSEWQQVINILQQWQQSLNAVTNTVTSEVTLPTWSAMTLQNGWAYVGAPYNPPAYYEDFSGRVWCRGLITGGTQSDGTVLATLPSPPADVYLLQAHALGGIGFFTVRLEVDTGGNIILSGAQGQLGVGGYLSLDQLNYSTVA